MPYGIKSFSLPRFASCPDIFKRFAFFLILTLSLLPAYGQKDTERLDDFLFKVAIIGPSDEIFIWWGHAALIMEDTRWKYSRVYDWGVFSYPSDNFLKDFIKNRVQYMVTTGPLNFHEYILEDRDITIYTLDLDKTAKEIILSYTENKILPDNCYYDYHEFLDNCSTGIRDIIDLGTRGQFKAVFGSTPGRLNIRQHVLRYTWFRPFPDWFLSFLMGRDLDKQITPWEEMFLPIEIARNIASFNYTDDSGAQRDLVSSIQIVNSSKNRPPILNKPLSTWPFFLTGGLIIAALLIFFNAQQKKSPRLFRIILGLIQSLLGLLLGISGCVLALGLFIMSNDYIKQNLNIFFVNPLLLIILPLGILFAADKSFLINSGKCLRILWTYVFISGSITMLINIIPFFYQQNQSVHGLILPIAFALSDLPEKMDKLWRQIGIRK